MPLQDPGPAEHMRALVDLGLFVPQEDAITEQPRCVALDNHLDERIALDLAEMGHHCGGSAPLESSPLLAGMGSVEVGGRHVHPARAAVISS